ncbi:hypothetical protein [Bacteroides sp.]
MQQVFQKDVAGFSERWSSFRKRCYIFPHPFGLHPETPYIKAFHKKGEGGEAGIFDVD